MGRDVLTNGSYFQSLSGMVCVSCKISGKGYKYTCLERGSCLSGKGVVSYLTQIKTLYIL